MTMHHTDPGANWLTTAEAAQRMGVSVSTVRAMVRRGDLIAAPRDRYAPYVISPASIAHLLRELKSERIARESREA